MACCFGRTQKAMFSGCNPALDRARPLNSNWPQNGLIGSGLFLALVATRWAESSFKSPMI